MSSQSLIYNIGQVVHGSMPSGSSDMTTVIVFVHGNTGKMSDFWTANNNNISALATKYGFANCFVNLDPRGSIKANALVLTQQLKQIVTVYRVQKCILICHGKGGIDAEGAIYYNNADTYIDRVITLGTPFWGSPFSDVLYDTIFTLKLPEIWKNSAQYDLQTSEMMKFRSLYDNSTKNVQFFCVGGTGTDTSAEFEQGTLKLFMNNIGSNDDSVLLKSTQRPKCAFIASLPYYHDQLAQGSKIWDHIALYLTGNVPTGTQITPQDYNGAVTHSQVQYATKQVPKEIFEGESTRLVYFIISIFVIFVIYVLYKVL